MRSDVLRRSLRIGMLHPELGLGGAERLVVDAAQSLQAAGHRVTLFTTRHDRSRCFEETADGTLDVRVSSPFWPSHIAQRMRAPCTIVRMAYLAATAVARSGPFDVLFCDLVAHVIPLLKRISAAKVVFYCHFPDQLLTGPRALAYGLYRWPIDHLETYGMYLADAVVVNSRFTADRVEQAFPRLPARSVHVVYPGVDSARYAMPESFADRNSEEIVLLSLNRYKPEKNHGLAIRALSRLRQSVPEHVFASLRLIIAGGFDPSYRSDRQTLRQLRELSRQLDVTPQVTFLLSSSESERLLLLSRCRCLVYTPANEHFGFGPLEAMAAGRPVVAAQSGGPLETIRDQETGLLCQPTEDAFAAALARLILDRAEAERMGLAGRQHIAEHFSLSAFAESLSAVLDALTSPPSAA